MTQRSTKKVAIIVAHPDDETLWAGGTMLSHTSWKCFVVCLCRGSDKERASRFFDALKVYKSEGIIGDLDDEPDQKPLDESEIEQVILDLLPPESFDLIITHNPTGEYTRHLRHEEISKAVITLWHLGKIYARKLWTFAYEDGNKLHYPQPVKKASVYHILKRKIWLRKLSIITITYGFEIGSFEAKITPKAEAFWQFTDPSIAKKWLVKLENLKMK